MTTFDRDPKSGKLVDDDGEFIDTAGYVVDHKGRYVLDARGDYMNGNFSSRNPDDMIGPGLAPLGVTDVLSRVATVVAHKRHLLKNKIIFYYTKILSCSTNFV